MGEPSENLHNIKHLGKRATPWESKGTCVLQRDVPRFGFLAPPDLKGSHLGGDGKGLLSLEDLPSYREHSIATTWEIPISVPLLRFGEPGQIDLV